MLVTMAGSSVPTRSPSTALAKRRWRYTSLGSVLLSFDFYLGIPAGFALGILPALNKDAATMATTILIAFGATLIAIAAVVIAALTIFVTVLSPEYLTAIQRFPGGVKSAVRPFAIVGWVCIAGTLCSFAAALGWPAIPSHCSWLNWLVFSIPASLTWWGLLGTGQLVSLGAFHLNQRSELLKAISEVRHHNQSSRSA
jgi:hypothetical protein